MPRIFDFGGREVERSQTVAGLQALKGSGRRVTQTTAETADEAAAADEAGVEMIVCRGANVREVRHGSTRLFVTAAIGFTQAVTADDMLRAAFGAVASGADAVITARGYEMVRMLTAESIPVVGHVGFVPRKSTWVGSVRAVGKTATEALDLSDRFRRLEDAGAFAVECELITADVLSELNGGTSLVTISLGSGGNADVIFLFASDICGESSKQPRHAQAWGDLARLYKAVREERVRALSGFRAAVASAEFPTSKQIVEIPERELADFRLQLQSVRK
jgi:3-methyl-2-oxobutanoate hydroxymethyltransferase